MPQSADFAEHYAVWVVAQRAHEPVEIVTDCNGVRSAYEAGKAAEGPDRPHAGLWRTIRRDKLAAVHKVKAHLSWEEAERRGMGHWWKGNYLVDVAAKRAASRLAPPVAEVTAYHRQLVRATKLLAFTARQLQLWPERPIAIKKLERAESLKGTAHVRTRHNFLWESVHQVFVCTLCGRARRRGTRGRPTECRPLKGDVVLGKLHDSHELWAAPVVGYGRPVVFCGKCKAYCTVKASLLQGPRGQPSSSTLRQYRYTIAVGKHPRTRLKVLLKPYRLSLAAAAAAAALDWTDEAVEHLPGLPLAEAAPRACWSADELGLAGADAELPAEVDWEGDLLEWFGPEAFEM
jgi:hypothetical protein